jgi:hypothetical protein
MGLDGVYNITHGTDTWNWAVAMEMENSIFIKDKFWRFPISCKMCLLFVIAIWIEDCMKVVVVEEVMAIVVA